MTQRKVDPVAAPTPEELAAYLDGELEGRARTQVQAWLAQHPDAVAELHAQRRLAALWQETAADEPTPAVWNLLLRRIERNVTLASAGQYLEKKRWPPRLRTLVPVFTAAAAVLVALLWLEPGPPEASHVQALESFPVAAHDEVDIISLEGEDHAALVVGKPPLSEPMVLVAPGDAHDIRIEPDVDGMVPTVARVPDGLATTMVVAPLFWGGEDGKD